MASATLTDGPAVQLTFPWALPKAEEDSTIVAERRSQSAAGRRARATGQSCTTVVARVTVERHSTASPVAKAKPGVTVQPGVTQLGVTVQPLVSVATAAPTSAPAAVTTAAATVSATECANSVQEALSGDRIGKPVRIGAVMFRLLKRYGITDEEIAEGIAAYTAKRNAQARA